MSSTLNPYFYAYNPELLAFESAWVNYIKNGFINESVIRPEIIESWQRCRASGLDPLMPDIGRPIPDEALEQTVMNEKRVLDTVIPFMRMLKEMALGAGFRILFANADGCILKSVGDGESMVLCNKINLIPGMVLSEPNAGTNGISLAIDLQRPIQLAGAEHYMHSLHRISCSAAPIINEDGALLGVLAVVGRYEVLHRHSLGMLVSTAEAIKNHIALQTINEKLTESNVQLTTLLNMLTDGVVYVKNDIITEINDEFAAFLGKPKSALVGHPAADVLITNPDIASVLGDKNIRYGDVEISLKGANRDYRCMLDHRIITDKDSGAEVGHVIVLTRIEEIQMLASKVKYSARFHFSDIIGEAPDLKKALDLAHKAAGYDARVIIEGESGTGKEMFAQAIHNAGSRRNGPFIAVDCGAIPENLLESYLFGYEAGAYTGAGKDGKVGLFELANKGTIFLDEIGNMSLEMQIKLLRVLQEGVFSRVGGTKLIHTDARLIAATNINLNQAVESGAFRHDLFYRLNVFYIKTPPLRDRRSDIPLLVDHFLRRAGAEHPSFTIDDKALAALQGYDWPGNIRQLSNAIERAIIMSDGGVIWPQDLPVDIFAHSETDVPVFFGSGKTLDDAMREYVRYAIDTHGGNVSKAAATLGISRTTVYKMLRPKTETEMNTKPKTETD
jgi:transcriptional regulator of acetoin/glycerol metabolism